MMNTFKLPTRFIHFISPSAPVDFTNPLESNIIKLQNRYKERLAECAGLQDLKVLKDEIKHLKAELSFSRMHDKSDKQEDGKSLL